MFIRDSFEKLYKALSSFCFCYHLSPFPESVVSFEYFLFFCFRLQVKVKSFVKFKVFENFVVLNLSFAETTRRDREIRMNCPGMGEWKMGMNETLIVTVQFRE